MSQSLSIKRNTGWVFVFIKVGEAVEIYSLILKNTSEHIVDMQKAKETIRGETVTCVSL